MYLPLRSWFRWRRPALLIAIAASLALVTPAALARPAQVPASSFTPVPCAEMTWVESDPSFAALPNAQAFFGRYDGGLYRMEIPANWNGDLVLAAHGYTGASGPQGNVLRVGFESPQVSYAFAPGLDPSLRQHLIDGGFAWAASSYRCNGYVAGIGLQDTLLLRVLFLQKNGGVAAKHTYLIGLSMGGHIVDLGMQE